MHEHRTDEGEIDGHGSGDLVEDFRVARGLEDGGSDEVLTTGDLLRDDAPAHREFGIHRLVDENGNVDHEESDGDVGALGQVPVVIADRK